MVVAHAIHWAVSWKTEGVSKEAAISFEGLDLPRLIVFAAAAIVYFMPWFIAVLREHRRRLVIGLLNLLLGWTLIGWFITFFWAASATRATAGYEEEIETEQAAERRVQVNRLGATLATYTALAVGGVLGVYARYGLTRLIQGLYGQGFPLATLIINLLGTFLLALVFVLTLERVTISPAVRTGIMTGGLGAFTTFSTFIMETLILVEDGQVAKAALYLALSVGLGITAAFSAVYIARKV